MDINLFFGAIYFRIFAKIYHHENYVLPIFLQVEDKIQVHTVGTSPRPTLLNPTLHGKQVDCILKHSRINLYPAQLKYCKKVIQNIFLPKAKGTF